MKGFALKLKSSLENVCLRAQATRRFFSPTEKNEFFKDNIQKYNSIRVKFRRLGIVEAKKGPCEARHQRMIYFVNISAHD